MDMTPAYESVEEVKDDVASLDATRKTLDLLHRHASIIARNQKVDRATVKELVGDCSVSLDSRYPEASFTQAPSGQNLVPVMESIATRAGELASEYFRKIVDVIVKIGRWIAERFRAFRDFFKGNAKTVARTAAVVQANQEIARQVNFNDPGFDVLTHPNVRMAIRDYDNSFSELARLFFSDAAFSNALRSLSMVVPKVIPLIETKIDVLLKSATRNRDDLLIFSSAMRNVATPIPSVNLDHFRPALGMPAATHEVFSDYMRELKEHVQNLSEIGHDKGVIDYNVITGLLLGKDSPYASPMALMSSAVEEQATKLSGYIEALRQVKVYELTNEEIPMFDMAAMAILQDIKSIFSYAQAINIVLQAQVTTATNAYRVEEAIFKAYRQKAASGGLDDASLTRFNEIQDELRKAVS